MEYIIENEFLRVTIIENGAQIKSVVSKCDGVEHMWNANPEVWKYHSPVMFPYAGKVRDGRIEIRNQVVENAPQHGFHRVHNHSLVSHNPECLVLALEANDQTRAMFPYQFRFLSTFKLVENSIHHILTVENLDEESFPFGIGYHPAFAVPFDAEHSITDYELRFSDLESPVCLESPAGLLNGKYYTLGSNIQAIDITDGMFDNDSHCMINLRSKTLGLYEKNSARAVVCDIQDFPYCLIWGKPGKPPFICIEPWHSLPSMDSGSYRWEEKAAAASVAPGESWSCTMKTSFVR